MTRCMTIMSARFMSKQVISDNPNLITWKQTDLFLHCQKRSSVVQPLYALHVYASLA